MSKTRVFLACCIAACMAVPIASPAAAQEDTCPDLWFSLGVLSWAPNPTTEYLELGGGSITIRGDLAAADAAGAADYLATSAVTFVGCQAEWAVGLVTPYADCVLAAAAPILASPDLAARYVEVGTDLVVRIHYGQALDDGIALFNCNGIVTSGS